MSTTTSKAECTRGLRLLLKAQRADTDKSSLRGEHGSADRIRTATMETGPKNMADLDWAQCPIVESIPGKVSGAWVLRGTRTPVKVLFENLQAGLSIDEVIEQFPVNREQIESLMAFVARSLDKPPRYG